MSNKPDGFLKRGSYTLLGQIQGFKTVSYAFSHLWLLSILAYNIFDRISEREWVVTFSGQMTWGGSYHIC